MTPRFHGSSVRNGRGGPSMIELSLVLTVIVGLGFVSMRIMNMPEVKTTPEAMMVTTAAPPAATAETKTP